MSLFSIKFPTIIQCPFYDFDNYIFNSEDHYIYGIYDKYDLSKCKPGDTIYKTADNKKIRLLPYKIVSANPKLLSSIIELRQKLPDYDYCHTLTYTDTSNIEHIEEQILNSPNSKKYINLILKWCKKYSLPFIGDIYDNEVFKIISRTLDSSYYGFRNDFNYTVVDNQNNYKFRLGSFLIGLDILYTAFLLEVCWNKEIYLTDNCSDYEYSYINNLSISNKTKKIFQGDRNDLLNLFLQSMRIQVKVDYNTLSHTLYADTLLSAAMYQLFIFIAHKNNKVAKCVFCNNLYIQNRKDKEFCSDNCRKAFSRLPLDKKTRYKRYKKD